MFCVHTGLNLVTILTSRDTKSLELTEMVVNDQVPSETEFWLKGGVRFFQVPEHQ